MKKSKFFNYFWVIGCCIATWAFMSCDDDAGVDWESYYPTALVTVRHTADSQFYLQLDEKTTLFPENVKTSPFGDKQVRALVNYTELKQQTGGFSKTVHVNWIDSILTKSMVPSVSVEADKIYGTDPIEIIKDWVTIAEDGYLTLRVRTCFGNPAIKHTLNLLSGVNSDNPYEVTLCHNAFGDLVGPYADALVAFDLSGLPDTEGKTVKLKINWISFSGPKSVEFDYCTRQGTRSIKMVSNEEMKFEGHIN